jgi:hypothetical protein
MNGSRLIGEQERKVIQKWRKKEEDRGGIGGFERVEWMRKYRGIEWKRRVPRPQTTFVHPRTPRGTGRNSKPLGKTERRTAVKKSVSLCEFNSSSAKASPGDVWALRRPQCPRVVACAPPAGCPRKIKTFSFFIR